MKKVFKNSAYFLFKTMSGGGGGGVCVKSHTLSVGSLAARAVKRSFAIFQSTNYFGQIFIEFFLCCRLGQIIRSDFFSKKLLDSCQII